MGGGSGQPGGHVGFFCIHREMHQAALGEHKDRFSRISILPVLVDRMLDGLPGQWILEFQRDHW